VGPRAVLDAVVKKISNPHQESNPRSPIVYASNHHERARQQREEKIISDVVNIKPCETISAQLCGSEHKILSPH
jgi:hypothetical protein